eukprot:jgi/Chrzof1/5383/Cz16g00240.t1
MVKQVTVDLVVAKDRSNENLAEHGDLRPSERHRLAWVSDTNRSSGKESRARMHGLTESYNQLVQQQPAVVNDVIRAFKAWVKYSNRMNDASTAVGRLGTEYAAEGEFPSFISEIVVMVASQQYPADTVRSAYELFLAALQYTSRMLTPSNEEPVLLERQYYSRDDAVACERHWGCHELYRPFIIHPVDASYNINAYCKFVGWQQLADAAGELYNLLSSSADCCCEEQWQQLIIRSSLQPAVQHFICQQ